MIAHLLLLGMLDVEMMQIEALSWKRRKGRTQLRARRVEEVKSQQTTWRRWPWS